MLKPLNKTHWKYKRTKYLVKVEYRSKKISNMSQIHES